MAKDTDGLLLTASLDIEDSYEKIKEDIKKLNAKLANDNSARVKIVGGLDLNKTQSLIQSQIATIGKNLKLNIGQIDTNSLNTALSNVQNKVVGTNNGLSIKPVIDGKIIEDTDVLIKAVVGKLQQLNNVDLNGFKNNLKNLGFSGKDVTNAANELVQALKLTPENKSVIIDSYQNLMDNIRNTITSDSMVADKGFDNRLVMSIYQAISEYKNLEQTATSAMAKVKATSASLNPVDNAINRYKEMDNTIQDISNKINQLKVVPNNATAQIDGLKSKLVELRNIEASEGRTENWVQKYREFALAVKETETNVKRLKLAEKSDNSPAQQQSTYYNKIFKNQKLIYNLKKKLLTASSEETTEINRQITNAQKRIDYSEKQLKKKQLESVELTKQKNELDNIYSAELKIANLSTKGNMLSEVDKVIVRLQSIPNQTAFLNNSQNGGVKQLQNDVQNVINKYNDLRAKIQALDGKDTDATANLRQEMLLLAVEVDKVNVSAKNLKTSMSSDKSMQRQSQQAELLTQRVKKLTAEINTYKDSNVKAMRSSKLTSNGKTFSQEIENMILQLSHCANNDDFQKIAANFRNIKAEAKSLGLTGGTIFTSLWANIKKFSSWMSMTTVVSTFVMDVRNAVTELKEIDTILTEISKTSNRTTESLEKLGKASFDTASKYGQKASGFLTGVQEMSRAGFGETKSEQMAELSTLAQSAGDMTAELANQYLVATNAAYKLEGSTEKLNRVLDGQNLITNKNALNLSELAEGTKIVASQAANAGIGADQLTAALGTMIATTQQSGSEMANALKGILINLQQIKGYTDEETGETFDAESLSKYEKACEAMGVSLKEMKDGILQLRDPMTILEDLANKYKELDASSTLRANLLSSVGGKYRSNALDSLLSNWDTYKKMLSEYNSSEAIGSAAEEAQKTAESWEGMFNALENDWTKFVNEFANSDLFKSLIESARRLIDTLSDTSSPLNFILTQFANLLELATKLTDTIGLIPTVIAGLSLKNVGEHNLNTPVLMLPQTQSIGNVTRFKIRLSNCWEMLMAV